MLLSISSTTNQNSWLINPSIVIHQNVNICSPADFHSISINSFQTKKTDIFNRFKRSIVVFGLKILIQQPVESSSDAASKVDNRSFFRCFSFVSIRMISTHFDSIFFRIVFLVIYSQTLTVYEGFGKCRERTTINIDVERGKRRTKNRMNIVREDIMGNARWATRRSRNCYYCYDVLLLLQSDAVSLRF